MASSLRILVTGASGLLGANFTVVAAERYEVTACCGQHLWRWPGVESCSIDLRETAAVESLMERTRPDIIAHFAAATDVDWCESASAACEEINVQVPEQLARMAGARGVRLVYMSTDSVFDGHCGGYRESDAPHPVNQYARSKLAGEAAVRALAPSHLIVRGNIYGWNAAPKNSLAEWVLQRLASEGLVPGFTDVFFNPLLANTLAEFMLALLDRDAVGTVHIGSQDALSKHEFAVTVAETFDYSRNRIGPATLAGASLKATRPFNTTLQCERLVGEFDLHPPTVRQDLARFRRLRDDGIMAQLKAGYTRSR